MEVMPALAASSFTVGLRCSSATETRLRNGSISWFRAGTAEWVKIVALSGSIPDARLSRSRLRTLGADVARDVAVGDHLVVAISWKISTPAAWSLSRLAIDPK